MGIFKKGYEAAREEQKRQDETREKMGKRLWRFFLSKDGEEATVRFLTEEPITFYEHTIKTVHNGKESYDTHICTQDGCEFCESGDRAGFKGAFLIYDKRPYEYTDKNGKKKKGEGQLRLYVQGTRVLSQLDRLSSRYGLTGRDYIITRSGSGTATTYMFDRTDEVGKLTDSEIKNMLPEKLRDKYDGTQESLYHIVEDQLAMLVDDYDEDDDDEEDDDYNESRRRNLVGVDDDDEDDEEEAPRRSLPGKKKSSISSPKSTKKTSSKLGRKLPRENSVKPLFKKK